jgi:hypothetical protein
MVKKGAISAIRRARVWLSHALLAAFVLKALIPAGFMPDFSGAEGGAFKMVVCTASGTKVVTTDADGKPHKNTVAKHTGEPCALGGLVALTLPDVDAGVGRPVVHATVRGTLSSAVALPPARAGPAHNPRAPPFLV